MKKFKYLPSEVARLNQVFQKNDVKLSFESFDNYHKCLEELITEVSKCSIRYHLDNYYVCKSHEYNVSKKVLECTGKYHSYSAVLFSTNDKINYHMNILREAFGYFYKGLFDIDNSFGIAYRGKTNIVESFYYKLTNGNLSTFTKEFFNYFLNSLNISKKSIPWLEQLRVETDYLDLNYVSFDVSNNLTKLGFATPVLNFLRSNFISYYSEYVKVNEFNNCVKKLNVDVGIGIQLSTDLRKSNFLALEIRTPYEKLEEYLSIFQQENLISSYDVEYIKSMVRDENSREHTIKFRWNSANSFSVKWYSEFPNEVEAPLWYQNV